MQIDDHIACLVSEGGLLAAAAERAGPAAPVPCCPGWQVRDLLAHLGFVHRWATGYIAEERTEPTQTPDHEEMLRLAPDDEDLIGWFREGHARLVSALTAADPAVRSWTFLAAPSPLAFWARRQAHETAIHRVDTQLAAAGGRGDGLDPFPPGLAADGVDELLTGFAARRPRSLADAPATLVIRARDGAFAPSWTVRMGSPDSGVSRGAALALQGSAYCEVSGPAPALYLLLWNRGGTGGLDVRGDAAVLATWHDRMRVRWR
jgi:uncharacterized protein (TIGR03083 family)